MASPEGHVVHDYVEEFHAAALNASRASMASQEGPAIDNYVEEFSAAASRASGPHDISVGDDCHIELYHDLRRPLHAAIPTATWALAQTSTPRGRGRPTAHA